MNCAFLWRRRQHSSEDTCIIQISTTTKDFFGYYLWNSSIRFFFRLQKQRQTLTKTGGFLFFCDKLCGHCWSLEILSHLFSYFYLLLFYTNGFFFKKSNLDLCHEKPSQPIKLNSISSWNSLISNIKVQCDILCSTQQAP